MLLWLILLAMTVAAILAVLWPLSRRAHGPSGSDAAVYRDQLSEIERDRATGLIGEAEAEAARIEVSRRLLAASAASRSAAEAPGTLFRRRAAAVSGLAAVPAIAVALYMHLGSPSLPGEPLSARTAPREDQIQSLIAQVEARLAQHPEDGRGWDVIAPVYMRLGRFDDAVTARRNALRLNGETAARQADLGEALVSASKGVVVADAKAAFDRALVLDAREFKARFFAGLAAQQDGQRDKAADVWRAMLAEAPADAPWVATVRQSLAELGERGPTASDVEAAATMGARQRAEMISGMVDGLAARLAQDGSDAEGWLRLMRAYMVLGERDKARGAAADARKALSGEPAKLERVEAGIKQLGVEG